MSKTDNIPRIILLYDEVLANCPLYRISTKLRNTVIPLIKEQFFLEFQFPFCSQIRK